MKFEKLIYVLIIAIISTHNFELNNFKEKNFNFDISIL